MVLTNVIEMKLVKMILNLCIKEVRGGAWRVCILGLIQLINRRTEQSPEDG